jgi:uncharacterized protein (DUF736 family)
MNEKCVGGLWIRTSKSGIEYFSIQIDGKNYVAFVNQYRSKPDHPHYRIFVSDDKYQSLPDVNNEVEL